MEVSKGAEQDWSIFVLANLFNFMPRNKLVIGGRTGRIEDGTDGERRMSLSHSCTEYKYRRFRIMATLSA